MVLNDQPQIRAGTHDRIQTAQAPLTAKVAFLSSRYASQPGTSGDFDRLRMNAETYLIAGSVDMLAAGLGNGRYGL